MPGSRSSYDRYYYIALRIKITARLKPIYYNVNVVFISNIKFNFVDISIFLIHLNAIRNIMTLLHSFYPWKYLYFIYIMLIIYI